MAGHLTIVPVGKPVEIFPVANPNEEITARVVGERTGEAHVSVQVEEAGKHRVTFAPMFADDYTLTIFAKGCHTKDSPHKIKALENKVIFADERESPQPVKTVTVVEIDSDVNFVLQPESTDSDPIVVVTGPFGPIGTTTDSTGEGRYITHFIADAEGEYYISAKSNGKHLKCSPLKVLAVVKQKQSSKGDLSKCYVLPEDIEAMSTPYDMKELVDLRVSTQGAGEGKLDVVARGSGKATIVITRDEPSLYGIAVSPSAPGRYWVNITWNGETIRGSPCTFLVTEEKVNDVEILDLSHAYFRVGKPYKFKIHSPQLGGSSFDVRVDPPFHAVVTIRQLNKSMYHVTLVPKTSGAHNISVLHNSLHVPGSPFSCQFEKRGDASKCFLIEDSQEKQDDIEDEVSFTVSTEGAGEGTLTATVLNVVKQTTKRASIEKISDATYSIKFNLDPEEEYLLSIKYDDCHIVGSPFKLSLSLQPDPLQCRADGEGLKSAYVNQESAFTVKTDRTTANLRAEITGPSETVQPTITQEANDKFKVAYTPKFEGKYEIQVFWNDGPIPGSPFKVECCQPFDPNSIRLDKSSIKEVFVGQPFSFLLNSDIITDGKLKLLAFGGKADEDAIEGSVTDNGDGTCSATFDAPKSGKYNVHIYYDKHHITGSPFRVKASSPPIPSKVNAYGPGLEDGVVGQSGSFVVETKEAGSGSLTVRVHGKRGAFTMDITRDPVNDRNILVQYNPIYTGEYLVEVMWSEVHIPGSPFKVKIKDREN